MAPRRTKKSETASSASTAAESQPKAEERDYGDSAGYGAGGAALDYDSVLAGTEYPRDIQDNPLDQLTDSPDHERVRLRAYYLWEQAGRPDGLEEEFWAQAQQEISGPAGADQIDS